MNTKTLSVLEYHKVLAALEKYCAFSLSGELARQLRPSTSLKRARHALKTTEEARRFLLTFEAGIGGARDIRPALATARRGGVLTPEDCLLIKTTLEAARTLKTLLDKNARAYPLLNDLSQSLPDSAGLIQRISSTITEKGEIAENASPALAGLRQRVKTAQQRLASRLQNYLQNSKTAAMLQDAIITQRDGRYVIPLKAQFKGQIKGIIHDQSASGATVFIEPLPVVELNNALRAAQLAVRDEERRILADLSAEIGARADDLQRLVDILADLDLLFAKAKYADALGAHSPELIGLNEKLPADEPRFALRDAWHPLLDPESAVRNDIILPAEARGLVITGPNTGGKTVTLKTVGLLALMAQSGLPIPAAADSRLPVFQRVYADIGDEQSIEQSLSTFSGHIRNIVQILKKVNDRSLVILDELGAGTDPQEGAALARAILDFLLQHGAYTFVATHYPELKTYAHAAERVLNASLEFNVQTLRPTYRLTIGLPGRSNALAIARRLGLPEEVLQMAAAQVDPEALRADDLLDEIQRQRKLAYKERRRAERKHAEVRKMRRQLRERLEKIEDERIEILEKAQEEAEREIAALKEEIRALRRKLVHKGARQRPRAAPPAEAIKPLEARVRQLERDVQRKARRSQPRLVKGGRPRVGEKVIVRSLGIEAVVQAVEGDEVVLQAGAMRMRVHADDLRRKAEPESPPAPRAAPPTPLPRAEAPSPGMQIDLRGQTAEDALDALDRYLEKAFLSGLPFVRVVHGKGTGALRTAIRQWLPGHPHVASFEHGQPNEGGEGVTIVHLRQP